MARTDTPSWGKPTLHPRRPTLPTKCRLRAVASHDPGSNEEKHAILCRGRLCHARHRVAGRGAGYGR